MGINFLDQYSLLHFATGIIAYYFGISFINWSALHFAFEIAENTQFGMKTINTLFVFWPGGKNYADSWTNRIGDQISGMLGWYVAYQLDVLGSKRKWFDKHIVTQ
jgi:hypothetical protein